MLDKEAVSAVMDLEDHDLDRQHSNQNIDMKRFWITDYPLLCYPTMSIENLMSNRTSLVLTHLCDPTAE